MSTLIAAMMLSEVCVAALADMTDSYAAYESGDYEGIFDHWPSAGIQLRRLRPVACSIDYRTLSSMTVTPIAFAMLKRRLGLHAN